MMRDLTQMLRLQWLASRWLLALLVVACIGLPQFVVSGAFYRILDRDGVFTQELILRDLASASQLFPLLAIVTGALIALAAWNWDHRTNHIYALTLPMPRARYALLKMCAGALALLLPAAAILVGALMATATTSLPQGLHVYPVAFAVRFLLASLVMFSVIFALASGTVRTTLLIFGTFLVVVVGGSLLTAALQSAYGIEIYSPARSVVDAILEFGPFRVFIDDWMLIDV